MARPSKPIRVINTEKKSHRTKAEKAAREAGEAALLTGKKMSERPQTRENEIAHKEFLRVKKMLDAIEKNDAIYEPIINRYCMLQAECIELEKQMDDMEKGAEALHQIIARWEERGELEVDEVCEMMKQINKIYKAINTCDAHLQQKRAMLLTIEKESAMTIAAALRTVPKNASKQEEDPLLKLLKRSG